MEPSSMGESAPETIRFRAGKKRKAYRQRADEDEDAPAPSTLPHKTSQVTSAPDTKNDDDDDDESSVAAALRLRNARKSRLRGVGFTTTSRTDDAMSTALVPHNPDEALPNIANRFTHQTGVLADMNDRHMMEYIESRLSNRAAPASTSTVQQQQQQEQEQDAALTSTSAAPPKKEGREILQGHLMEIDLSKEARPAQDEARDARGKRRRLGKDGKPWRPRNRRGSDAIKRDQLVDEILRENRLDVYEVPAQLPATGAEEDGAADERLAEEFRRQFLDDVAERQMKKKKVAQPARSGTEDVLKGPKLGGSRNSRAAMRDMLLKKEKDGKK